MPGCFKKTLFALASVISFVSFILIVVAMGTPKWMTGKILCKTGADLVNATDPELIKFIGEIYYGLFRGGKIRQCGLGGRRSKFTRLQPTTQLHKHLYKNFKEAGLWDFRRNGEKNQSNLNVDQHDQLLRFFPHMVKKLNTGLHVMIVMFLCVAICFSLVSFGFCILNAIKVPYRAIKGPAGVCLWNFLAGGFVVLAVTSFMAAVKLHHLTERIANFRENVFQFVVLEECFEDCFWICVASATAHAVNLLLIAISGINFPKIKPKTEEVNVTAEDIMY